MDQAIEVGDQFLVVNYRGTGIKKGRVITVTRKHSCSGLDGSATYSVRCNDGCPLLIKELWLEQGFLERV